MKKRLPRLADDVLPKLEVPVRRLLESDRADLLDYYRRLSLADRTALFGFPLPDDKLAVYVNRLDFAADGHFAARGAASVLIGVSHCIIFDGQGVLNVHVAHGYRRRGIGTALGTELVRFGNGRGLGWLRSYFSKSDPIAASLARVLGMDLNFGIDRFYAEIPLAGRRMAIQLRQSQRARLDQHTASEAPEVAETATH